jgi:hypothetical protein
VLVAGRVAQQVVQAGEWLAALLTPAHTTRVTNVDGHLGRSGNRRLSVSIINYRLRKNRLPISDGHQVPRTGYRLWLTIGRGSARQIYGSKLLQTA